MDEYLLDLAEKVASAQVEEGLERARRAATEAVLPEGWDGSCTSCGTLVPPARVLATGSCLCVDCKQEEEHRLKLARR